MNPVNDLNKVLQNLVKTLEAGNVNVAPGQLVQGGALQIIPIEPVMQKVTFESKHIKLQKLFDVEPHKSLLVQFRRQLSYGQFGGSAVREGAIGNLNVGDYVSAVVPMCFYAKQTRVTVAANMVDTIDGVKAEDREAENTAMVIAGDIEFDSFRGKDDFSNNGVFDGNPLAMPELPNILGVAAQIRQSDILQSTQDLMFAAYGSSTSVVLAKNGSLDQIIIQDASLRSRLNFGEADTLYVDPVALAGYNKQIALGTGVNSIQRIILAGKAQDVSGADLRRQWVTEGEVQLESSNFLRGRTLFTRLIAGAPSPITSVTGTSGGSGAIIPAGTYVYVVTAENEIGESSPIASSAITVNAGEYVTLTITAGAAINATHFNVYRGTSAANAKFIGRVKNSKNPTTTFIDLGNKAAGFTTGYLIQANTWAYKELAPYSRMKLAISDLSVPEAHFRFLTLVGYQPRKNVLIDNIF
jgi:hypothetical protein